MNTKVLLIIIMLVITIVALGYLYQTVPQQSEIVTVEMKNQQGESLGTIDLSETMAGVLLAVKLTGLTPNTEHAIHIHESGNCTGDFSSAGGHYNPVGKEHGLKNPEGHHAGDMPNLNPNENGQIEANILNRDITLRAEARDGRASVFDADGSAIVIHEGADDHMSQPSGAAGGRFACGVIQKQAQPAEYLGE